MAIWMSAVAVTGLILPAQRNGGQQGHHDRHRSGVHGDQIDGDKAIVNNEGESTITNAAPVRRLTVMTPRRTTTAKLR